MADSFEKPAEGMVGQSAKVLLAMKCQMTMMGFDYIIHTGIYGLKICGKVSTSDAVRTACKYQQPEVLIIDPELQEEGNLSLLSELLQIHKGLRIVVFTKGQNAVSPQQAIRAGALAYITEGDTIESVLEAVGKAHQGKLHIGSYAATKLFQTIASGSSEIVMKPVLLLTPREKEVFRQRGVHNSIKGIATELELSVKTVDGHLHSIKRKLKVKDGAELRLRAMEFIQQERHLNGEGVK